MSFSRRLALRLLRRAAGWRRARYGSGGVERKSGVSLLNRPRCSVPGGVVTRRFFCTSPVGNAPAAGPSGTPEGGFADSEPVQEPPEGEGGFADSEPVGPQEPPTELSPEAVAKIEEYNAFLEGMSETERKQWRKKVGVSNKRLSSPGRDMNDIWQDIMPLYLYDEKSVHTAIKYYMRNGRVGEAVGIFENCEAALGIPKTVHMYNCIINEMLSLYMVDDSLMYFQRMLRDGVYPNSYTFSCLMDYFTQHRNWKSVDTLYHSLKETGLTPSLDQLRMVLRMYGSRNLRPRAMLYMTELTAAADGYISTSLGLANELRGPDWSEVPWEVPALAVAEGYMRPFEDPGLSRILSLVPDNQEVRDRVQNNPIYHQLYSSMMPLHKKDPELGNAATVMRRWVQRANASSVAVFNKDDIQALKRQLCLPAWLVKEINFTMSGFVLTQTADHSMQNGMKFFERITSNGRFAPLEMTVRCLKMLLDAREHRLALARYRRFIAQIRVPASTPTEMQVRRGAVQRKLRVVGGDSTAMHQRIDRVDDGVETAFHDCNAERVRGACAVGRVPQPDMSAMRRRQRPEVWDHNLATDSPVKPVPSAQFVTSLQDSSPYLLSEAGQLRCAFEMGRAGIQVHIRTGKIRTARRIFDALLNSHSLRAFRPARLYPFMLEGYLMNAHVTLAERLVSAHLQSLDKNWKELPAGLRSDGNVTAEMLEVLVAGVVGQMVGGESIDAVDDLPYDYMFCGTPESSEEPLEDIMYGLNYARKGGNCKETSLEHDSVTGLRENVELWEGLRLNDDNYQGLTDDLSGIYEFPNQKSFEIGETKYGHRSINVFADLATLPHADRCLGYVKRATELGLKPSADTFALVLYGLHLSQEEKKAEALFERILPRLSEDDREHCPTYQDFMTTRLRENQWSSVAILIGQGVEEVMGGEGSRVTITRAKGWK